MEIDITLELVAECEYGGCPSSDRCLFCEAAWLIEYQRFHATYAYEAMGPAVDDQLWYCDQAWVKDHPEDRTFVMTYEPEDDE